MTNSTLKSDLFTKLVEALGETVVTDGPEVAANRLVDWGSFAVFAPARLEELEGFLDSLLPRVPAMQPPR